MERHKLSVNSSFLLAFLISCHLLPPPAVSIPLLSRTAAANMGGGDAYHRLQTYIVLVAEPDHMVFAGHSDREEWHKSFLPTPTLDFGEPRMIYSYRNVISGFAARLTPAEVEAMEAMEDFLYALPDEQLQAQTTYTPQMLGLRRPGSLWEHTNMGEGIIVGVVDSGIMHDHPSFRDNGMPPKPRTWVGGCDFGPGVCNNKLIGARAFNESAVAPSPEDEDGHGTHVASIAAGNFVTRAAKDWGGAACGIAAGMAPRSHLAFYKTSNGAADTARAIDQAIYDSVDVINLSLAQDGSRPFHVDIAAIATLSAVKKGIFVATSAGNDGPARGSILNVAPWTLTVGASTTGRVVTATLTLGDGRVILGESTYPYYRFKPTAYPLVYPGEGMSVGVKNCSDMTFGGVDVKGKVVMCMGFAGGNMSDCDRGFAVSDAGGVAVVRMNQRIHGSTIHYQLMCHPTVSVSDDNAKTLRHYVRTAQDPTVEIRFPGTELGIHPYPVVAYFSSRGPSSENNGILKPDVLGPGVNILAARNMDKQPFTFDSGTSMASPHLAGIAALLKKSHPRWSPAAIQSAIMTTSDALDSVGGPITDQTGNPADLFAIGAGHVNVNRANTPGLVYDREFDDYLPYICGMGYTERQIRAIVRDKVNCSTVGKISGEELNYPSFFVKLNFTTQKIVRRTVTNVGPAISSYTLFVDAPIGVSVDVFPRRLDFSQKRQRRDFTVTFTVVNPNNSQSGDVVEGVLRWISGRRVVRSPISVTFT